MPKIPNPSMVNDVCYFPFRVPQGVPKTVRLQEVNSASKRTFLGDIGSTREFRLSHRLFYGRCLGNFELRLELK